MRDELRRMLEKAENKLKTARIDFDSGQYDDSVSRAYYAIFHALSAVLLAKGFAFSSHSQVIGAFNKEYVKTGVFPKEYTAIIQGLFSDRQTADYDFVGTIDKAIAEEGIRNAEKIIASIRSNLSEPHS
jgi:uncharacterized protein (UPF0332 family)